MKYAAIAITLIVLGVLGYAIHMTLIANPATVRELRENPQGERAKRVMLLSLPSGKEIPVNYLREGGLVYAGADGLWWKELRGEGSEVEILIQGESLRGRGQAIENDPEYRRDVFKRLRPTAPDFTGGILVVIEIADEDSDSDSDSE
jgi:hypothetical protein